MGLLSSAESPDDRRDAIDTLRETIDVYNLKYIQFIDDLTARNANNEQLFPPALPGELADENVRAFVGGATRTEIDALFVYVRGQRDAIEERQIEQKCMSCSSNVRDRMMTLYKEGMDRVRAITEILIKRQGTLNREQEQSISATRAKRNESAADDPQRESEIKYTRRKLMWKQLAEMQQLDRSKLAHNHKMELQNLQHKQETEREQLAQDQRADMEHLYSQDISN
jgi:hypothetical protein